MQKYAGTQSIARVFMLIKLFDDYHPIWSLPELIEASSLKRTTVFRMLAALEAEGIIRKTATGEYTLGAQLIMLGGRAIRSNRLRTVAEPYLHELVHQASESVTMDVLWVDEDQIPQSMVIEERLSQHLLGLFQYIGARFPAHTTSTGKVLLAYQPKEVFNQLNLDQLTAQTKQTIISPEQFRAELAKVRRQGFASTRNELEIGLTAVAAPIFNHHGEIQAALCIGGPTSRISKEKLAELSVYVRTYANQISQQIGYELEPD